MLTQEEDIDANALYRRGWTISAIARHMNRDRKTVRAYVTGQRIAGQRRKPAGHADPLGPYLDYIRARFAEDPHLWAVTLFDEVQGLGYLLAYATFTRQLRERSLRPHCEACAKTRGRPAAVIEHPPGEEVQWDWVELPDPPTGWGYPRATAYLLVGALACSGKWRGVLCESMTQPHLIDALDRVTRSLGGLPRTWRFDRMATVCHPESGRVTGSFAAVAKHYSVKVAICPPRAGNRKGVVEKANHTAAQRWWRTLPDDVSVAEAQARLDAFCARVGDARIRTVGQVKATVATHAASERLAAPPARSFPTVLAVARIVDAQALVSFRGNRYSVTPQLVKATVTVSWRLGATSIGIVSANGDLVATHRLAPDGAGVMVRDQSHVAALEREVLGHFDPGRGHRRKERIPPGPAARAAADTLKGMRGHDTAERDREVVIDLGRYAKAAAERTALPDTDTDTDTEVIR